MAHTTYMIDPIMDTDRLMYKDANNRKWLYSRKQLKAMDEAEGAVRITGTEMNGLQRIVVGAALIQSAMPMIQKMLKRTKTGRMATYIGGIVSMCRMLTDSIPRHQMAMICDNVLGNELTVSSMPTAPGCKNLSTEAGYALTSAALHVCAYECTCEGKAQKTCKLRFALDQAACLQPYDIPIDEYDPYRCPYKMTCLKDMDELVNGWTEEVTK